MKYRPCGYHVLVKMDVVKKKVEEGALAGFQLSSDAEHEREENGHCIGTVIAFGPTAFKGHAGCDSPEDWGVSVGDKVEFNRYDGKIPLNDEKKEHRLIFDSNILMVVEDE